MIHKLIILLCFFLYTVLVSQESPFDWGDIPAEQLEMTDCEFEPGAEAMVLGSWGGYNIYPNTDLGKFEVIYKYHFRIKILKQEGLEEANISIPYWGGDKLTKIKAQSINLVDGKKKITELQKKAIYKDINRDENIRSVQKFTIPNVKVGTVIEYSYTLTSDRFYSLRTWYFQRDIPVLKSIYQALTIKEFTHVLLLDQFLPIETNKKEKKNGTLYSWTCVNAPSIIEEAFVPNVKDYYTHLDFQLQEISLPTDKRDVLTTWDNVAKLIRERANYKKAVKGKWGIDEEVIEDLSLLPTEEEKLRNIYQYIQQNHSWDGRLGIIPDDYIKKIETTEESDGPALNLLLLSALKKMGIEAYPILISTREHGKLNKNYPFIDQFNHVIIYAMIDGKPKMVDAATNKGFYHIIPERDLNGVGFLIREKDYEWIEIKTKDKWKHTCSCNLEIKEDGKLVGLCEFSDRGYSAWENRVNIFSKGADYYFNEMIDDFNETVIINSDWEENEDYTKPLKSHMEVEIKDFSTVLNDFIYINPMLFEAWQENPFNLKERRYPVDFAIPIDELFILNLEIPEGYVIEDIPEKSKVAFNIEEGLFDYNLSVLKNKIQVISKIKINQTVFPPEVYQDLKEFFNLIVEKHAEQIVLKKNN